MPHLVHRHRRQARASTFLPPAPALDLPVKRETKKAPPSGAEFGRKYILLPLQKCKPPSSNKWAGCTVGETIFWGSGTRPVIWALPRSTLRGTMFWVPGPRLVIWALPTQRALPTYLGGGVYVLCYADGQSMPGQV